MFIVHTKECVNDQEMNAEDIELLWWRAELADAELETSHILFHTEHNQCCDPMNRCKTVVQKLLCPVAKDLPGSCSHNS